MTLNEPLSMEAAQALARRTLAEGGHNDEQRIEYAFRCCVSRKPEPDELNALLEFLTRQAERFTKGAADPTQLVDVEEDAGITPAQLAAWTAVSRVVLNLDETITKE